MGRRYWATDTSKGVIRTARRSMRFTFIIHRNLRNHVGDRSNWQKSWRSIARPYCGGPIRRTGFSDNAAVDASCLGYSSESSKSRWRYVALTKGPAVDGPPRLGGRYGERCNSENAAAHSFYLCCASKHSKPLRRKIELGKGPAVDGPPLPGGRYVERSNSDNAAVDAFYLCYS